MVTINGESKITGMLACFENSRNSMQVCGEEGFYDVKKVKMGICGET